MKKTLLLFAPIAVISAAGGIYLSAQRLEPSTAQDPAIDSLFAQTLPDAQGKSQALSQWKGNTLVVNLWATWCAPCVQEMPELYAFQTEIAPKNVQIFGIGIDSAENIREV